MVISMSSDNLDSLLPSSSSNMDDASTTMLSREETAFIRIGMIIGGRYKVERFLGRGGMGDVWLASEIEGEQVVQSVVLKIIPYTLQKNSIQLKKFMASFELARQLRHPNICSALTMTKDDTFGYFLVMDYVNGIELSRYQKRMPGGVFSFQQTLDILTPIATSLDYAHKKKIIHRDIKPQNIMIPFDGETPVIDDLQIIDFGLAMQFHSTTTGVDDQFGATSGTIPFMPPEQINGMRQDARTDQYSMVVMAYRMLSGKTPFASKNADEMLNRILSEEPPRIEYYSSRVNNVLRRGLAKDRKMRYSSCTAFLEALRKCEKSAIANSGDTSRKVKTIVFWVIIAIVLLLLIVLAFISGMRWR